MLQPSDPPRPIEILIGTTWIAANAHADRHDRHGAWTLVSYQHGRTTTLAWTLNSRIRPPRKPRQP